MKSWFVNCVLQHLAFSINRLVRVSVNQPGTRQHLLRRDHSFMLELLHIDELNFIRETWFCNEMNGWIWRRSWSWLSWRIRSFSGAKLSAVLVAPKCTATTEQNGKSFLKFINLQFLKLFLNHQAQKFSHFSLIVCWILIQAFWLSSAYRLE